MPAGETLTAERPERESLTDGFEADKVGTPRTKLIRGYPGNPENQPSTARLLD
jgi:hypothetical protein